MSEFREEETGRHIIRGLGNDLLTLWNPCHAAYVHPPTDLPSSSAGRPGELAAVISSFYAEKQRLSFRSLTQGHLLANGNQYALWPLPLPWCSQFRLHTQATQGAFKAYPSALPSLSWCILGRRLGASIFKLSKRSSMQL